MIRLLIADDECLEREALTEMVSRRFEHEAVLETAENGRKAADTAILWGADLILMDIEMPGMSGLDAARAVLAQRPGCRVIFVTAYSLFQYAHEAVHLGACDYLLKPVDPDELEASIRRAMRQIETERKLEALAPVQPEPMEPAAPAAEPDDAENSQNALVMAHVRRYLEDNYMFDISLDSVGEILHISPAYLSAQFKKYQKMNFLDCLTELRINAAKELLTDPFRSSAEVASMVGYEDASYFARAFKKRTGEFPIVKDTTPNMMNPRLYTTSYNKPQGQQFETAVLSFIKLQYTEKSCKMINIFVLVTILGHLPVILSAKSKGSEDMKQILIVEDDSFLNKMLDYNLTADGYGVTSALNARTAAEAIRQREFDLVLLDINLPDGNGFELCKLIKPQHPDTIVIFLTANDQESDQIRGYEVGAVDYITKPFVIGALQRKIKAMFAMLEHHKPAKDIYDDGRLFLDFSEQTASLNGKPLTLSPMEYKMLNLFRKNPRQVLTRGQLLEKLWDIDERFVDEHTLTTSISRIRSKIEADGGAPYIKTVYGMGYQWTGGEAK